MPAYPNIPFSYAFSVGVKQWETIRDPFENGYVQTRQKFTRGVRLFGNNAHENVSAATVNTFLAFWDSVHGEADTFTVVDPHTSQTFTVRFAAKPTVTMTDFDIYSIQNIVFEEAL